MAKILTIAKKKDSSVIYKFVKLLATTHGKDGISFGMTETRFINAFDKNFFLVNLFKENEHEINGIMLHMKEYSSRFNGFGCYLDDFYLDSSLRGKGVGRKMLSELCQNLLNEDQKFIKVVFQKNLDLDNFYNHFGFVNYSDNCNFNLYEGNNSDLENILAVIDNETNEIKYNKITQQNHFPVYEIFIKRNLQSYKFCCQFYFNSWCGFGILLTDFVGNTDIARLSDFKMSIDKLLSDIRWNHRYIQALWWHVLGEQYELGNCIESCFAENIHDDGWKISYLNEEGMKKLSNI